MGVSANDQDVRRGFEIPGCIDIKPSWTRCVAFELPSSEFAGAIAMPMSWKVE